LNLSLSFEYSHPQQSSKSSSNTCISHLVKPNVLYRLLGSFFF